MEAAIFRPSSATLSSSASISPHHHHHYRHRRTISAAARRTLSISAQLHHDKPVVVVGSANADIYVEIDRLPSSGETVSARAGFSLAGGKGANQACCAARLGRSTTFIGQIGSDANGRLIYDALESAGVKVDRVSRIGDGVPTGHAVVMLLPNGQNSIIIVGGANVCGWPDPPRPDDLDFIRSAGVLLLQREIPDSVNVQVAQAAKDAGVPVILDAGGMDTPIKQELLNLADFFSPNESELARITGQSTETFDQISEAVFKLHKMGVRQVLVKLGEKGSALFLEGEEPLRQPIIPTPKILDTTGAGDTYTAAFAVGLVEGKTKEECLKFAAAAASLCVQVKGAIPSMPHRDRVLELLCSVC